MMKSTIQLCVASEGNAKRMHVALQYAYLNVCQVKSVVLPMARRVQTCHQHQRLVICFEHTTHTAWCPLYCHQQTRVTHENMLTG